MTDLQIKYQSLLEQERANQAQEQLKSRDIDVREQVEYRKYQNALRELDMMNSKLPYEINLLKHQALKTSADRQLASAKATSETSKQIDDMIGQVTGSQYMDDIMDGLFKFLGKLFGL